MLLKRFNLMKYKESQVLVTALVLLAIILTIGASLLFRSRSFRDLTNLQVDLDQAYTMARSGIAIAESFIAKNPCGTSSMDETYNLGEGDGVRILIDRDSLTITSTGFSGDSVQVLKQFFTLPILEGWVKAYGGGGYDFNYSFENLQQTDDGGYILGGHTQSFGAEDYDFLLIKIDSLGNCQWTKHYGGLVGDESLFSVQQTDDGGYILGGRMNDYGGWGDIILIKTDAGGNVGAAYPGTWAKTYVATDWQPSEFGFWSFFSLRQTDDDADGFTDDGYIVGGTLAYADGTVNYDADILLLKTDADGNVGAAYPGTWAKRYGGDLDTDYFYWLQQTADGGFIFTGTFEFLGGAALSVKIDSLGIVEWARNYGGFSQIYKAGDGGYFLVGGMAVIKINSLFETEWAKTYNYADPLYDAFIQQTQDGGCIFGGFIRGFSGMVDGYRLIKTDSSDNVEWVKTYDGPNIDEFYSNAQAGEEGYVLQGHSNSFGTGSFNFLMIKTNSLGNVDCCNMCQDVDPASMTVAPLSITPTPASVDEGVDTPHTVTSVSPTVNEPVPTTTFVCPSSE